MRPVPARAVAALFGAAALATPLIVQWEGWERVGYRDPVGLATACAGTTKGAVVGKTYTDAECEALLVRDVISHGQAIKRCLPDALPVEAHAAFISAAYNIGAAKFCGSSMSRRSLAGDLAGACAALSLWTKAGGVELRGLVRRRQAERSLCERGLHA